MLPGESEQPPSAAELQAEAQADAAIRATSGLIDRLNAYLREEGWEEQDWPDDLETHWTNDVDQTVVVPYVIAAEVEQRLQEAIEGIAEAEDRDTAEVEADLGDLEPMSGPTGPTPEAGTEPEPDTAAARDAIYAVLDTAPEGLGGWEKSELWRWAIAFGEGRGADMLRIGRAAAPDDEAFGRAFDQSFTAWFDEMTQVPDSIEQVFQSHRPALLQAVFDLAVERGALREAAETELAADPDAVRTAPEGLQALLVSEEAPPTSAPTEADTEEPGAAPAEPETGMEGPYTGGDESAVPAAEADSTRLPAPRFRPRGQEDLGQTGGPAVRARANIAALRTLRALQAEDRPATTDEQALLAKWSGWGAASQVFDEAREEFADLRAELRELLSDEEYRAARATTVNAHYTDAAYVQAIWEAVGGLGFDGGEVLEPGCGSGAFIGFAPDGARMTGVELDPTTASIAQMLYPDADVLPASFAKIDVQRDAYDLTVGNVPFHDSKIHDPAFNPNEFSTHNYFISKSLQLTRPGGLVAVLTSSYTMDAVNPAVRREFATMADLVGAVRLPNRAHRAAAGTDALTDVLVFRRREPDAEPAPATEEWELTVPVHEDGTGPRLNAYFQEHPECVLGEIGLASNMHAGETITVTGEADSAAVAEGLRAALDRIVAQARESGLVMTERTEAAPAPAAAVATRTEDPPDRFIRETESGSGEFQMWAAGDWRDHQVPKNQVAELRALLELRDAAVALLDAEATTIDDTDEIADLRAQLNARYDAYADRYGPINRVKLTPRTTADPVTGERVPLVDEATGAQKYTQRAPGQGGFRGDAHAFLVRALEHYNPATGEATKANIFTERVLVRRAPVLGADTPADALAISLDRTGGVDLELVAELLGVGEAEARDALGTLVFDDPDSGELVTAAAYCSGDIRYKLDIARGAAADNPALAVNVEALEQACPADLTPAEITPRMGAVWIPAADVQAFLREILEDRNLVVEHAGGATWAIDDARSGGPIATSEWGTLRMPAPQIAEHLLTGKPIRLERTYETPDGVERTVLDQAATAAATAKAEAMAERFRSWLWSDPDRCDRLVDVYNRTFNSAVPRTYTGEHLTLPGLSTFYKLRPHQLAAVDRMINEPSVGLFHEVGAGKTLEMVVGTAELKRLGMASKPAIVVPNHMLDQFTKEYLDAYPQANLLAASTADLTKDRRREFIGRIATGNWDAVIFTHSAFERIGLSTDSQVDYFEAERSLLEVKLDDAKEAGGRRTVKEIESGIKRIDARIEKLQDAAAGRETDTDLTFEQTGIDYLCIDEAHLFKNRRRYSVIESMTIPGSNRASDLDMKLAYLREQGRTHVAAFATATPLPNSMGEAHTMISYLRPDLLEAQDVLEFDAWANTYGETVTAVEIAPEGGTRAKTRFAKFTNVPELMRTFHTVADIKLADDLDLPVPDLAERPSDGKREAEIVAIPPSTSLALYMADLMDRAGEIRTGGVDPVVDNMLKIAGDGRAAATDVRLRGMDPADEPQKADIAADKIAEIWNATRATVYTDPATGEAHPTPGGLQLVFCDQGTPKPGRWSVYEQLRANLVDRGMDPTRIRFIHEAKDDKQKAAMFAAARAGEVDVLVGSTEKMGVGTNVQTRVTAMHHLDCPWRPADVVQREGRGIRQGNQNAEVRILRYVVESSFDGYMWQTVARKAQFIAQVMRGDAGVREIEDIDEATLSFNEVKAIASGDPRILEHADAAAEVAKLEAAERAHQASLRQLHFSITGNRESIGTYERLVAAFEAAMPRVKDTRGDNFAATIGGTYFTEFTAASEELRAQISRVLSAGLASGTTRRLGSFAGFDIQASVTGADAVWVELAEAPGTGHQLSGSTLATAQPLTKLRNGLGKLEEGRDKALAEIEQARADIARAEARLDAPFPKAAELEAARMRFAELDTELAGSSAETEAAPLPPGGVRIALDSSAGQTVATGVTEGWLGERYAAVVDGLTESGFTLADPEEGRWTRPLSQLESFEQDQAADDRAHAFEERLGAPVQLLIGGEVRYTTAVESDDQADAPAEPTVEESPSTGEPEAEAATETEAPAPPVEIPDGLPVGYLRLDALSDGRQVLRGWDSQHLRRGTMMMGQFAHQAEQLGFTRGDDGTWERREAGLDQAGRSSLAYRLTARLRVPIQTAVDGTVAATPGPAPWLYVEPPPVGLVRIAYHETGDDTRVTVTGVDTRVLGQERFELLQQRLAGQQFTESIPGIWEGTAPPGSAADDATVAAKGPRLAQFVDGPLELFRLTFNPDIQTRQMARPVYTSTESPAASRPDGRAAARSATTALGGARTTAPVSPAAPAVPEQAEPDRAR